MSNNYNRSIFNLFINLHDKFDRYVILWAIDVPHIPRQRDAKM